jgi:type II secretion system protein G
MLKHLQASRDWDTKNLVQKGFTLVELLVVIVILGILAAVVVFAVSGIQDRGQTSACQTDANTIRTAVEAYRAQAGHLSTDDPSMANLVTAGLLQKPSTLVDFAAAPNQYTNHAPNLVNLTAACNGVTL